MSKITFLRRERLGYDSVRSMAAFINQDLNHNDTDRTGGTIGERAGYVLNKFMDRLPKWEEGSFLVRWGCTSRTNYPLKNQINSSAAIKETSNKRSFRMKCMNLIPHCVPESWDNIDDVPDDLDFKCVVRTSVHSQGHNLWTINSKVELADLIDLHEIHDDWYMSRYIKKVDEYRVYIVEGRVVKIDQKIPDDRNAVAWNCHHGGKFVNVKWGDWPVAVFQNALEVHGITSLDFGGFDIMVDEDGRAYLLEVNSAPSVTFREDGLIAYSQKCMAKGFQYILDNGKGNVPPVVDSTNWKGVIHPALRKENDLS